MTNKTAFYPGFLWMWNKYQCERNKKFFIEENQGLRRDVYGDAYALHAYKFLDYLLSHVSILINYMVCC